MTKKIESAIKALIALTFFVPLIFIPSSFIFPFIVPKILLFRSLTLLMLGGYILLLATNWSMYAVKRTSIKIAVGVFFASSVLSTFFGTDWYHSFWDNHERMLGLFTIAHFVAYFFVASTVVRTFRDWRWLFRIFLCAGSLVMLIGVYQEFVDPTFFLNSSGSRVASTLGNPIYVGGYGLFLAFVGWLLFVKEKEKWWKVFAAAGGILGVAGIFFSGTRGALLGWVLGVILMCLLYILMLRGHARVKKWTLAVIAGLLVVSSVLFVYRKSNFVQQLPAIGSLANTSLSTGDAETRLIAWGIAIEAWKEYPVFGWGLNNYFYAFNKFYKPQSLEHGWGETWFDNAHNIILNTLAVEGLLGLLAYLGMYIVPIVSLWRARHRGVIDSHIAAIGISFLVAHMTANLFVFENPTSYLYFFFFIAFLDSSLTHGHAEHADAASSAGQVPIQGSVSSGVAILVGLVVCLFLYATDVNPARANMQTLQLLQSLYTGNDPIGAYEKAFAIPTPHIDDIRNDFARAVFSVMPMYVRSGREDIARKLFQAANEELRKNLALHPLDIRIHLQKAQLAEQGAQLFHDAESLLEAEAVVTDALQKSPRRQQVAYTLASIKFDFGKINEAAALIQKTIDDDPKVSEGWWRLALLYQQARRMPEAQAVVRKARAAGVIFDGQGLSVINGILPGVTGTTK